MRKRALRSLGAAALAFGLWAATTPSTAAARQPAAGSLRVTFFYDAPTTVEPTYHTAIWLEDKNGRIVQTLYVSQELSDTAYKLGRVCPDWVKQANWSAAPKSEVAAVTAPTPNVGVGEMTFDLAKLGVAPGTYAFRFQVHISEQYNILYRGQFTTGGPDAVLKLETVYGPGKLETTDQFVRDVEVRYVAPR
jgi:hypothetical protein